MRYYILPLLAAFSWYSLPLCGAEAAQTGTVLVLASDVIYAAGNQSAVAESAGGTVPEAIINLPPNATGVYVTKVKGSRPCFSSQRCISLDNGTLNDPDGAVTINFGSSSVGGGGLFSGITAPGIGYLVAVFIAPGGPTGPAPKNLDYTIPPGTSKRLVVPELDQVFYVGDGLTGDNSGTRQVFKVPPGASQLIFGISDASLFNGPVPATTATTSVTTLLITA